MNWENLSSVLEVDLMGKLFILIEQFPSELLPSVKERIKNCNQLNPIENVLISKSYWKAKLTELAIDIKKVRRKLKLNYTPSKQTIFDRS